MKRTVTLIFSLLLLLPPARAQEPVPFLQLVGRVLDGATGKPLHYASVNLSGTNVSNVTNTEGVFALKVSDTTPSTLLVTISHLGYATKALKIADFEGYTNDNPYKVVLSPVSLTLNPALIRAQDPVELVLAALYRIKQNYPDKYVGMTAFYRELVKKGSNRYLAMNEAVIDINKAPYTTFQIDRAGIYKGRGSQNYDSSDTLFIKYQGGLTSILEIDQAKNPFASVFLSEILDYYKFSMEPVDYLGERMYYVVSFDQKPDVEEIKFRGRLFIDSESLAIGRVEMWMNVEGREDAAGIFILKRPKNTIFDVRSAEYIINYKPYGDKWYYEYAKMELKFDTRKKHSLFRNHFTVMSEIAVTDHKEAPVKIEGDARVRFKDQMTEKVSAFTDDNFWENYIEPDADIEAIIRRIVRQLKKHNLE